MSLFRPLDEIAAHLPRSLPAEGGERVVAQPFQQSLFDATVATGEAWELAQEFHLEGRGPRALRTGRRAPQWFKTIALNAAPTEAGIPDGPDGMGASALTNEYFNNAYSNVYAGLHLLGAAGITVRISTRNRLQTSV